MARPKLDIWIKDYRIPVRVRRHWQPTIRFSITSRHALISLPKYYTQEAFKLQLNRLHTWVKQKTAEQPELLERFKQKSYRDGQKFHVRGMDYFLKITSEKRKSLGLKITDDQLHLKIPEDEDLIKLSNKIPQTISRAFAKLYQSEIEERVHFLNENFFGEDINKVKLKYTRSNWGSCSSKRNINLSTRLLMAPKEVLDYVIIHELAHLKEMNHSEQFWTWVRKAMPDYKKNEAWLKTNGFKLVF